MINNKIYKNCNRATLTSMIHLECDTSSACYRMSDDELIECFESVFGKDYLDELGARRKQLI